MTHSPETGAPGFDATPTQLPPTVRVLHVGPAVGSSGGIAAVIEVLCRVSIPELTAAAWPTWWPKSRVRSTIAALRLAVRLPRMRRRFDVIHVHLSERGSFVREGGLAVLASGLGFRTAGTLHGADFAEFARAHPRLARAVLRRLDVAFCLGQQAAAATDSMTTTAVVLNPVAERAAPNRSLSGPPVVLFAGVIGTRKGFDVLAAAWPAVLAAVPDAWLHAAGPLDDLDPASTRLARFTYHGLLTRTGVDALLDTATVSCLPSRREALPMFVLESLAAGVPVVTTPVGEIAALTACPAVHLTALDPSPGELAELLVATLRGDLETQAREAYRWSAAHSFAAQVAKQYAVGYSSATAMGRRLVRG